MMGGVFPLTLIKQKRSQQSLTPFWLLFVGAKPY